MLYVVATPIGNLEDISLRALRILEEVDLILCEDTRVTKKLLFAYNISKPLLSYHQHSNLSKSKDILENLKAGKKIALVSDSGTPGISDPGAKLIDYLTKQLSDLKVVSVPGPSAVIAALTVSGLPADKFIFLGFPPNKKKRKKFFEEVVDYKHTVVFYESPHRIFKTLEELKWVLIQHEKTEETKIVVCRELTKKFETIYRGGIEGVINQLKTDTVKGEFVVVLN